MPTAPSTTRTRRRRWTTSRRMSSSRARPTARPPSRPSSSPLTDAISVFVTSRDVAGTQAAINDACISTGACPSLTLAVEALERVTRRAARVTRFTCDRPMARALSGAGRPHRHDGLGQVHGGQARSPHGWAGATSTTTRRCAPSRRRNRQRSSVCAARASFMLPKPPPSCAPWRRSHPSSSPPPPESCSTRAARAPCSGQDLGRLPAGASRDAARSASAAVLVGAATPRTCAGWRRASANATTAIGNLATSRWLTSTTARRTRSSSSSSESSSMPTPAAPADPVPTAPVAPATSREARSASARSRLAGPAGPARAPAPAAWGSEGLADVLRHLVGMQAQLPGDPYVGLWSGSRPSVPRRCRASSQTVSSSDCRSCVRPSTP